MGADPTLFDDGIGRRRPQPRSAPPRQEARIRAQTSVEARESPAAVGVADLNAAIAAHMADGFPSEIWVRGEIASFRRRNSKHLYFELVERLDGRGQPSARIDAVVFAMRWRRIQSQLVRSGVTLADGMELCVRGTVDFYAPTGRVQFVVTGVDPAYTLGRMAADRDQVLRTLAAEGLLEANAALPVPVAPLRVGVVTALGSAADNDFRAEMGRSGFGFRIVVADCRVQGPATIPTTIAAMRGLVRLGVEVVALVRGGGSRTDLSWFDDERIARAIAASPVPVFTGIGHEIDTSVADHAAHSSFKTPTSCAAALVERVGGYLREVDVLWAGVAAVSSTRIAAAQTRLADLARRSVRDAARGVAVAEHTVEASRDRVLRAAPATLSTAQERLREKAGRLQGAASASLRIATGQVDAAAGHLAPGPLLRRLDDAGARLDSAELAVGAFDPARVLERGFSLTLDARGHAIRDASALVPGAVVRTLFARGEAKSEVLEVDAGTDDRSG